MQPAAAPKVAVVSAASYNEVALAPGSIATAFPGGAAITVTNLETGAVSRTVASESGNYSVAGLVPGRYRVVVEKQGFVKTVVEPVDVFVANVTTAGVTLQVGSVSETVTVTEETPMLASDSAAVNTTVESKLLGELPFAERSSLGAVLLLSGCQMGGWSMSMRDFHGVPVPHLGHVPQQWEPATTDE